MTLHETYPFQGVKIDYQLGEKFHKLKTLHEKVLVDNWIKTVVYFNPESLNVYMVWTVSFERVFIESDIIEYSHFELILQ